MAATITRYVNPGSSGGDGTTSATSGANAAYASCNAWEAAEQTNLDTANNIMLVYAAGTTADTTACAISGWTTSATDYIDFRGDNTSGKLDAGKYRLTGIASDAMNIGSTNVRVSNVAIETPWNGYECFDLTGWNGNYQIHDNVCKSGGGQGINVGYGVSAKIWNNVIYECNGTGIRNAATHANENVVAAYSNTLIGNGVGMADSHGHVTAKNNIAYNNTTDYSGTFAAASTHNLSKDTTAPALNTYYVSKTLTFVNAAGDDYHLASGDTDAIDMGTATSGESAPLNFTTDIDGTTRSGTWDIGADEYVSAEPTPTPTPGRQRILLIQ